MFRKERCSSIVNSPFLSLHPSSPNKGGFTQLCRKPQGRDHFSVIKVLASQLWYCRAFQTASHFGVRRCSLQGVWVSVYQMAKAKRPFSEKWALPSHCACSGLFGLFFSKLVFNSPRQRLQCQFPQECRSDRIRCLVSWSRQAEGCTWRRCRTQTGRSPGPRTSGHGFSCQFQDQLNNIVLLVAKLGGLAKGGNSRFTVSANIQV